MTPDDPHGCSALCGCEPRDEAAEREQAEAERADAEAAEAAEEQREAA